MWTEEVIFLSDWRLKYFSMELETSCNRDFVEDYLREQGFDYYKVYIDLSCGAEVVTVPYEFEEDFKKIPVDAWDIVDSLRKIAGKSSKNKTSTHVTFTSDFYRSKPVPHKNRDIAVQNCRNYYAGIIFITAMLQGHRWTRKNEFRAYYYSRKNYFEKKSNYPGVFVPDYWYNDLPPYHKIEWRIPDSFLFTKYREDFYETIRFLWLLTTKKLEIDRDNMPLFRAANADFSRIFYSSGTVYNLDTVEKKNELLAEIILEEIRQIIQQLRDSVDFTRILEVI